MIVCCENDEMGTFSVLKTRFRCSGFTITVSSVVYVCARVGLVLINILIQLLTRMVQLPATAAIEYVAAGHFFPGGLLAGGSFGPGDL